MKKLPVLYFNFCLGGEKMLYYSIELNEHRSSRRRSGDPLDCDRLPSPRMTQSVSYSTQTIESIPIIILFFFILPNILRPVEQLPSYSMFIVSPGRTIILFGAFQLSASFLSNSLPFAVSL